MELMIGNLCSLLAMVADSFSASRKTVRGMLGLQCVGLLLLTVGSVALKGYSAAVQDVVSIFRNLLAGSKFQSKAAEWAMVILGVVLGLLFNNLGLIGLLPVIANLGYTLAVFRFREDNSLLKAAFLINVLLYAVFNGAILNVVGAVSNIVVAATTVWALLQRGRQ